MKETAQEDHLLKSTHPDEGQAAHPSRAAVSSPSTQLSQVDTLRVQPEDLHGSSQNPATASAPESAVNGESDPQNPIDPAGLPAAPSARSTWRHVDAAIPAENHPEHPIPPEVPAQVVPPFNLDLDLEAQDSPAQRQFSFSLTRTSAHLNNIYASNMGIFRVLGSLLVCAGVAFTLWQALESRQQ